MPRSFPSNVDTLTTGQLIAALGRVTTPELSAILRFLKRKHDIDISIPSYSPASGLPPGDVTNATLTNFQRQEWLALIRNGQAFGGATSQSAGAAVSSACQLRNAVGGTQLTGLVYEIVVTNLNAVTITVTLSIGGPSLAVSLNAGFNLKSGFSNAGLTLANGLVSAGNTLRIARLAPGASFAFTSTQGFLAELTPSAASPANMSVTTQEVNVQLDVSFFWAEVPGFPAEPTYL